MEGGPVVPNDTLGRTSFNEAKSATKSTLVVQRTSTFTQRSTAKQIVVINQKGLEEDEADLLRLGYHQQLYRGFSPLAAFAFCFTSVSVIPSLSTGLISAVGIGGPAEIIWSWFIVSALSLVSGMAMAELAAAYPQAGSVYAWAGQLASPKYAPAFAYITGWFNAFGNLAGDAAFAAGFSACVAYCVTISYPDFVVSDGAQVAISIGIHFVWTIMNFIRTDYMGNINNLGTFVQMAGTAAVIIVLLAMSAERASASFVFTQGYDCTGYAAMFLEGDASGEVEAAADGSGAVNATLQALLNATLNATLNGTGNETNGTLLDGLTDALGGGAAEASACTTKVAAYTIVLGLINSVYAFVGYEAGTQIAEETQGAAKAAPWGIIGTVLCCFAFGTAYLLGFLFATPDITQLEDPFVDTFTITAGRQGGLALMIILVLMFFFAGIGGTGASSRIIFALARDQALPFSGLLEQVWGTSFVPRNALIFVFLVEAVLLLLPLVNSTALTSVTGACSAGYCISYAIPFFQRFTTGRDLFKPAHFSLGRWSMPFHVVAFIFQVLSSIVLFWPTTFPVDGTNMNWTVVVTGAVLVVAVIHWVLVARYTYIGPKRNEQGLAEDTPASQVFEPKAPAQLQAREEQGGGGGAERGGAPDLQQDKAAAAPDCRHGPVPDVLVEEVKQVEMFAL